MIEAESAPDHHTIEEIHETLGALSDADWERLRQLGRNRCRRHYPEREDECVHEAIIRLLDERRKWPRNVNFFAFMSMTMKSLVDEWVTAEAGHESDKIEELPSPRTGAAGELFEKEVKDRLMALFEDDEDAWLVIDGWFDGLEKADYIKFFDGDETRYDTVRTRIRRKLPKHRDDLREMINGE